MILTGLEIAKEISNGRIVIDPFDPSCMNPNSYNYHLGGALKISRSSVIDATAAGDWDEMRIAPEGLVLQPDVLYLGHTAETIGSHEYVTSLIGRSSVGRLGMFLQISADLGHQGSVHKWTLEMRVVQRVRVYPGMKIGQVSFWAPVGDAMRYTGGYGKASGPAVHCPAAFGITEPRMADDDTDRARDS
jgi:dCTP deaminase